MTRACVWRVLTSHLQNCHCDNNTSGRKTSVCIQELFAGVGVLHLEGRSTEACHDPASAEVAETARQRRPGLLPPPQVEAGAGLSLEVARLQDEAETGRRRITELEDQVLVYIYALSLVTVLMTTLHPQVECLLTERRQMSLGGSQHRGKAPEQNNNNNEYSDG